MPIVYILTNESMPDTIKIGITDNLERRIKEFSKLTQCVRLWKRIIDLQQTNFKMINQNLHKNLHNKKMSLVWLIYNISKRSTEEWEWHTIENSLIINNLLIKSTFQVTSK